MPNGVVIVRRMRRRHSRPLLPLPHCCSSSMPAPLRSLELLFAVFQVTPWRYGNLTSYDLKFCCVSFLLLGQAVFRKARAPHAPLFAFCFHLTRSHKQNACARGLNSNSQIRGRSFLFCVLLLSTVQCTVKRQVQCRYKNTTTKLR